MTKEEAIAILQEEIDGNLELTLREWRERDEQRLFPALRMAIESLSAEPSKSTEQNVADVPSGDTISRAEVHKVLSLLATEGGKDAKLLFSDAHEFIDALPSTDRHEYNLESIADIVKQLGHLDGCIADMCGRPQVNSNSAEEQIAETCDRPKGECDDKPEPYIPEASTERVVHCKDCIYSEEIRDGNDMFACNNINGMPGYVHGDDFCSSGSL